MAITSRASAYAYVCNHMVSGTCLSSSCCCSGASDSDAMEQDEFWDYEHQVDLEGYSSPKFYDQLNRQSNHVTAEIDKHKREVGWPHVCCHGTGQSAAEL